MTLARNWLQPMPKEPTLEFRESFSAQHFHLIEWAYAQAKCARWKLSLESFGRALQRSGEKRFGEERTEPCAIEEFVKSLHLEDLALACACSEELEPAWEFFVSQYRQQLYSAARAILHASQNNDDSRAHDLADSLYAELYGLSSKGNVRRVSLFQYFHGRSKLSTWLRTVLAQRYIDQIRNAGRTISLESDGDAAPQEMRHPVSTPLPDPDSKVYLARLDAALSAALISLQPRDRLLLAYYYLDELTLREISKRLGQHESTVSRQLERIRGQLRETVTQALLRGTPRLDGQAPEPALDLAQVNLAFECALWDPLESTCRHASLSIL